MPCPPRHARPRPPPLETTAEALAASLAAATYAKLPLRELFLAVQQEESPWPK